MSNTKLITVCVLFYGDHFDLASRCLNSIGAALPVGHAHVDHFRLGLNAVSIETREFVDHWARCQHGQYGIPSIIYEMETNQYKYPVMRKMFHKDEDRFPLSEYTMWFDDDSYFEACGPAESEEWWWKILSLMSKFDMIGQNYWVMPVQGKQWEWIKTQPWYNPDVGTPKLFRGKPVFRFVQGAWWVIRSSLLIKLDWPIKELRHNGGDSLLGEVLRHQRCVTGKFYKGVRINADSQGRHSKALRRGHSENRVGWDYDGTPLSTTHHDFPYQRLFIGFDALPDAAINLHDA